MHTSTTRIMVTALLLLIGLPAASIVVADSVERPYMLWTAADIAAMRSRLADDPDYARRAERTLDNPHPHERHLLDLWRYAVKEDDEAGRRQKQRLLYVARSREPRGAAQWLNALRYDLLYDTLTADERAEVETFFRTFIDHRIFRNSIFDPRVFNDERNYSRYHAHYHRIDNWLPNITGPAIFSANLLAAALGDEKLIRRVWDHYGSWRWYFDEYLTDRGFYGEEFSKKHALPGEMLLYCIAMGNLGLDELGFGYTGRHGATMRNHIESSIWLMYPFVNLHGEVPHMARYTHGDARNLRDAMNGDGSAPFAFGHFLAPGSLPDGRLLEGHKAVPRWHVTGAWGGEVRGNHPQWDGYQGFTPKMQAPLWFEIAHVKYPRAGFDFFLARMRQPGQQAYEPSIYFHQLDPIHPDATRPPRAPSWVAEHRGVAMLRAEESGRYWNSPLPAAGVRLASPYAHDVFDNFVLTGFYAFNRPIYINRHIGGYARDWTRSVLSHAGVLVDAHEPAFTRMVTTRYGFHQPVKFLAMRSRELYPDIDAMRGLILTDAYLFDAFALRDEGGRDRTFRWAVHPLGLAKLDGRFAEPRPLTGQLGHRPEHIQTATRHRLLPEDPQKILDSFGKARMMRTDDDWHLRIVQDSPIAAADRALPPQWYERRIGVDLRMAAEAGSKVLVAGTPVAFAPDDAPDPARSPRSYEVGGASIIVQRTAAATVFAALHEPFEAGAGRIGGLTEIGRDRHWGAWHIGGPDDVVNDRIYLRYDDRRTPVTVEDGSAVITFTDWALVRIGDGKVEVFGDVRDVQINIGEEHVDYYHNGRLSPARIDNGVLTYSVRRR